MANGRITLKDLTEKFNAAGVYTIYNDNPVSAETAGGEPIRLIAGFSKIGWFNVPIFIEKGDYQTAELLYGSVDKSLERKGSFFHHSINVALAEGGVLAINLLNVNNEVDENGIPTENADVVPYRSFSVDIADLNGIKRDKLYASYFRKDRFWTPDKDYLLATRDEVDKNSILSFTNLLKTPLTILTRKSDVEGFDIPVKEWYVDEIDETPPFLRLNDLISDYFIDVIVLVGDYGASKYKQLSVDPLFGNYFDENGLIKDKLEEFLNRPEVTVKKTYTGCMIPKFRDKDNTNYYIESLINNDIRTTGILCAIDTNQLDAYETGTNQTYIDLIGHRLVINDINDTDFLSYKRKLSQDFTYTNKTTNATNDAELGVTGINVAYAPSKITINLDNTYAKFAQISDEVELGTVFGGITTQEGTDFGITVSNPILVVSRILKSDNNIVFDLDSPLKEEELGSQIFVDIDTTVDTAEVLATDTITITNAGVDTDTIEVVVDVAGTPTVLGSYVVQAADGLDEVAAGVHAAIQALTGTHGFVAVVLNEVVIITAPIGSGADANAYVTTFNTTGTVAATAAVSFTGGVTKIEDMNYETTRDRFILDGTNTYCIADTDSQIYADWKSGDLTNGDKITDGTIVHYAQFEEVYAKDGIDAADDYREILTVKFFTDSELTVAIAAGDAIVFGDSYDSRGLQVSDSTLLNFISLVDAVNERFDAIVISPKTVRVDIANETKIKLDQYLVGLDADGEKILTRITNITRIGSPAPTHIEITCDSEIKQFINVTGTIQVERYLPIEEIYDRYDLTALDGFEMKAEHMPNGTNARMKEIYKVMTDSSISDGLADPEMIEFRYFVDTFNHGLEPQSKNYLSDMIMRRQKAIGLLNCPRRDEFEQSANPRFTDSPTAVDPLPSLNVGYIKEGGNKSENPDWLYTLPEESDGASFVGFFYPNIAVLDNRNDVVGYPPAAYVSNNFVLKYQTNPYLPAAGQSRGVIAGEGVTGVDHPLIKFERGQLQQKGINPIYRRKNGSVQIMGDETAYKKYRSVLNNLSARDTLISIEIAEEQILNSFTFEFNNDNLRTTVEALLEDFLGGLSRTYGAIETYDIIFDRKNNPDWVIREGAAIVDTEVELPGITKRFVNRITLRKSGGPVVGGFVSV